ncbi:bifunctional oligoribonuclease/PAP phosphatase NrnA [Deinococcus sp.]|uniref:DHH family phosphoesterase n=1 Tax=Deinococcus sp. TaxID=47478 RepID=UPI0025C0B38D|nr:bifunctional oligoribonuclease/PAP phosphatase NrnA [Deinococcus sp.]
MTAQNTASPEYHADLTRVARTLLDHTGPFVILSHENPDGDALGSVLGLTRALRSLGRDVTAPMTVPRYLKFLPEPAELSEPLPAVPQGALVVVLDVDNNDPSRVAGLDLTGYAGPVVNIDHHGTNARRATALLVDPSRPATALMITDLLDELGVTWTEALATPLMLGLNTDTGSFRFDSVTPGTFSVAARLRAHGARLGWLNDQLGQNPPTYYHLLREVLGTMQFLHAGRVVLARVDQAMLDRAGAAWEDVESYVGLLRSAEGTLLAVMVKDYGDHVKLSMRSRAGFSAQNVAVALGGGGHVPAAGASVAAPFAEVLERLNAAITAELARLDTERSAGA